MTGKFYEIEKKSAGYHTFDSNSDDNELDIEGEINQEIKKMEGVDAKVVSYRKLD